MSDCKHRWTNNAACCDWCGVSMNEARLMAERDELRAQFAAMTERTEMYRAEREGARDDYEAALRRLEAEKARAEKAEREANVYLDAFIGMKAERAAEKARAAQLETAMDLRNKTLAEVRAERDAAIRERDEALKTFRDWRGSDQYAELLAERDAERRGRMYLLECLNNLLDAKWSPAQVRGDVEMLDSVAREYVATIRREALEEAAHVVEDADIETFGGWERQDDGRRTLQGAAKAIRALAEKDET